MQCGNTTDSTCGKCRPVLGAVFIALIIFLLAAAWSALRYADSTKDTAVVSFTGTGEVVAASTVAHITFTFSELNDEVNIARTKVSKKVTDAYAALANYSVEDRDIRTVRYGIQPEYDYTPPSLYSYGERKLLGYRVSHTTSVRIRDLEKTGKIIDAVTRLNPTKMDNLRFALDDEERKRLEEEALVRAIRDAEGRARRVAEESGLKLGDITAMHIDDYGPMPYYKTYAITESTAYDTEETTPIQHGEDAVTKTVTITYEISD